MMIWWIWILYVLVWEKWLFQIWGYSGSLNISAFDRNAEILSELAKQGKEYYVFNTKDQIVVTVSINNNVYKIHLETVK